MIPIRIDRRLERTPWLNYALIAANVLVYLVLQRGRAEDPALRMYLLHPDQPEVLQFFTSMFMHAGLGHLIGNMIFLWVFGNAVNDSFGHLGYLAFYLAGGVMAGIGYVLLSGAAPVLGASGAISAVTGAFLVLFPRVRVTVLAILVYMWFPFEISSLYFLLLQFAWNLYATILGAGGGVAYVAHASGYLFGIGVAAVLLWVKLLPRDVYDLPSLIRTWRRRWGYQRMVRRGFEPFRGGPTRLHQQGPPAKPVEARVTATRTPDQPPARELQLRQQIAQDHRRGDFAAAAGGYLTLVQVADDAVLPLTQQLDVANYLMSTEQYPAAADAYQRLLRHYGNYEYVGDIRLMLGLIYSRYLRQYEQAEAYLAQASADLLDESKAELARAELAKVRQRLGR